MGQAYSRWYLRTWSGFFKFLELPAVVRRQVLRCLQLRDLFILSQLSKKAHSAVRDAVVITSCALELRKDQVRLMMQHRNVKNELTFIFGKPGMFKVFGSISSGKAILEGKEFDCQFDSGWGNIFYTREQNDTDAISTVHRYFSELFHFPSYQTIFMNVDFLENFESIELFEDYMFRIGNPKIQLLRVFGAPLTGSDLIRIVDNVNCTNMILIDVPFRGRLNYHKINTLNSIQLCDGQVKESDFLSFEMKNIYLSNVRFPETVLVKFVRKWLQKESKIESLILKLHESKAWKSEEEVFGWLGTTKWGCRTRGRYYKWKAPGVFVVEKGDRRIEEWDCSGGVDIVRNDGLTATISLTEDTFTFFVWN